MNTAELGRRSGGGQPFVVTEDPPLPSIAVQTWNLADLLEGVTDVVADREAVVGPDVRLSYAEFDRRANQVAHALTTAGIGAGDHVALALRNGHRFLEATFGAFKVRAVPVNVNTRYTSDELAGLFADARPVLVISEDELAEPIGVAAEAAGIDAVLWSTSTYDDAVSVSPTERPVVARSGDDHYLLYTGGTTGLPKGVLWRHEDLLFSALGGGNPGGDPVEHPPEVADRARDTRTRCLPASPFSHGTANWSALSTLLAGGTVIVDDAPTLDAERLWDLAERERATMLVIVGDAFAGPLADALGSHPDRWELDEVLVILSGGATLSSTTRTALLDHLPWAVVVDGYGTSETGGQGQMPYWAGQTAGALPRFHVDEDTAVLDDGGRPAPPGSGIVGRLARRGHLPIGYHGDEEASARTFVDQQGQRWAIPGDLARVEGDGSVTLLGRGSSSINTGGEKVFPEEVEIVLRSHESIVDAIVVGIPDTRFGERVGAVVAARSPDHFDRAAVEQHCRATLANYKLPRHTVVVDALQYRPSGKADLAWARELLQQPETAGA